MQDHDATARVEFRDEEERVRSRSAVFRKELGLADLVLTQVLFVVGFSWVGVAAKQGPSHIILWLVAMLLFYIPSAAVVIYLNRMMPLEGGLYQWAKLGFNDLIGFLVAWNLWLFVILNMSTIGLQVTEHLGYIVGPSGQGLAGSTWFISAVGVAIIGVLVLLTVLGLRVGKWVHTAGGVLMLITYATLLILPFLISAQGSAPAYNPFRTELPVLSFMTLNLLGKLGFGALGGFEYVAIHAGECRHPARSISRSVLIAAPIIAVMFILGTSSAIALIPREKLDEALIAPIPKALSEGFSVLGYVGAITPVTIMALLCIRLAKSSVMFTGNTRLPMVAGWDRLLPEWFSKLHAKYKTPVNSIIFVGAATLALGIVGLIGVGRHESFQLLWNSSGAFYALTYLTMFAIPLFGLRDRTPPPPMWVKASAVLGLLMTLLYLAFSIDPIIPVSSRLMFAVKISGLVVITNAIGLVIYLISRRSRRTGDAPNMCV